MSKPTKPQKTAGRAIEAKKILRHSNNEKDEEIERLKEKLKQYENLDNRDLVERNETQIMILEEHNRQLQEQLSQLQAAIDIQNSSEEHSSEDYLQAEIKILEEHNRQLRKQLSRLQAAFDTQNSSEGYLQAEIKKREEALKVKEALIDKIQTDLSRDLDDEKRQRIDIQATVQKKVRELRKKDEIIEKLQGKIKQTSEENDLKKENSRQMSSQKDIKKLSEMEDKIKQLKEDQKREIQAKEFENTKLKNEKETIERKRQEIIQKLTEMENKMKQMKEDQKKDTERLGKVICAKVTDDNPDINDLSDLNRPRKLAETYSELFDHDWTDAFEEVENEYCSVQEVVKHLYQSLVDIYEFCQKTSDEYAKHLKACAFSLPSDGNKRPKSAKIDDASMRQLKELRKSFAQNLVENVFQHYIESKKLDVKKKPMSEKFIRECVRVCWLMSIQDPPVILDTSNVKGAFDTDRFGFYTKVGQNVDFVVWPPMLLHKNGPVLRKGVAQGKRFS